MAGRFLSDEEAQRLSTWPPGVARCDRAAHFTLSVHDRRWVRSHRGAVERIGLAVQLGGLRYLGFVPPDVGAAPPEVVRFVAGQTGVAPATFARYARDADGRTRRRHVAAVVAQAGWRVCGPGEWKVLEDWLTTRALEHDTPSVLFRQALAQLRSGPGGQARAGPAHAGGGGRQAQGRCRDPSAAGPSAAVGAGVRSLGPERLAAAARTSAGDAQRDGGHLELLEARFRGRSGSTGRVGTPTPPRI